MRVRLVRPLFVDIARLDAEATAAVDPPGLASSGYDPDFQEPVLAPGRPDGIGTSQRQEMPPVRLPAQVEVGSRDALQQSFGGDIPDCKLVLVLDTVDLRAAGLIDTTTGAVLLRSNDRVVQILSGAEELLETFPNPPGLFITEARPGFGLDRERNIVLAFCDDRERGLAKGA